MARTTCPECRGFVEVVPWVPDEEIGLVPQFLRAHFARGHSFAGKPCPGSRLPVRVWAVPEQREGTA